LVHRITSGLAGIPRQNDRSLTASRPPDIPVARFPRSQSLISRFSLVERFFFCFTGQIISCAAVSAYCLFPVCIAPEVEERHSLIPGPTFPAIHQSDVLRTIRNRCTLLFTRADTLTTVIRSYPNVPSWSVIDLRALWQSCHWYPQRDKAVVLFSWEPNQLYIEWCAAHVRSHSLQAGGQTRLVAFASIASYIFTQLIQQPGVGRWDLIRVSGVHRVRDRHRLALAWMAMYHRDTPIEDIPRYSACTTLCHDPQEYGGFATSSSSLCADHRLLKGRFPVTIYNTRCQPNMH
jgi:hypothetical protein